MSVVDEAVEDGVGQGGFGDDVVPAFNRYLAGGQCRGAAERSEEPRIVAVGADEREIGEELGQAVINVGDFEPGGLLAKRA